MNTLKHLLNKYNITVGRQYFIDIPEMKGSADLARLFAELKFTVGAEIGTDIGLYAEFMLQTIPNLKLYCVDPWQSDAYEIGKSRVIEKQPYFDDRYNETKERLKPYNAVLIRKTSMDALADIPDNSLDFVYIDANHDFVNVALDIHYWLKKVKPGGILSGHDYARYASHKFNHVKRVIQAYAPSYNLLPVFAVSYVQDGLPRDRFRSWFLIKPDEHPKA